MRVAPLLTAFIVLAGLSHLGAEYAGRRRMVYLCKPLTTALILVLALVGGSHVSRLYQTLIVLGLAASLVGDVFLMLPDDRFAAGLASFLLAHLLYAGAFVSAIERAPPVSSLVPFALYGVFFFRLLAPHVGRLRWPVLAYAFAILFMAWAAAGQWFQGARPGALLALLGAMLFLISDSVLGWHRFRRRRPSAPLVILSTYYAAQWCIARST